MRSIKFIIIGLFINQAFAAGTIVQQENINEADSYKIEGPVKEQDIKRSFAGGKIKKKKDQVAPENEVAPTEDSDSEVRYWRYSEE